VINHRELYARRCARDLVYVVEQVPVRVDARAPLALSESTMAILLLWSLLRWERTLLIIALEELGVDLVALAREIDELLKSRRAETIQSGLSARFGEQDHLLRIWLNRAAVESQAMGTGYLGTEHLLLSLIAGADAALAPLLHRHGLEAPLVRAAIIQALRHKDQAETRVPGPQELPTAASPRVSIDLAKAFGLGALGVSRRVGIGILTLMITLLVILFWLVSLSGSPPGGFTAILVTILGIWCVQMVVIRAVRTIVPSWSADADRTSVGVPRRFGMGILMLMVTLFAILFSIMTAAGVDPIVFIVISVLVLAVGFGQAILYRGRSPRLASIQVGAVLVPLEVLVAVIVPLTTGQFFNELLACLFCSILLGPIVGYLAGCVTAGAFFFIDEYQKKHVAKAILVEDEDFEFGAETEGEAGSITKAREHEKGDRR
jgi:Clp amino terminal domain, pathogenicity island component